VFAPTNAAFGSCRPVRHTLVKPEKQGDPDQDLTYHVVGQARSLQPDRRQEAQDAEGEELTVKHQAARIWDRRCQGRFSMVNDPNVNQSNG